MTTLLHACAARLSSRAFTCCHVFCMQAYLKQKMDQQFQAQQAGLMAKLAQLEGQAAAGRS
jgi:hypothetical protein